MFVDVVSLITRILVREERCTCQYIGRLLVCRQRSCLPLRSSSKSNIIELENILEARISVVTCCMSLVLIEKSVNILVQFVNMMLKGKGIGFLFLS